MYSRSILTAMVIAASCLQAKADFTEAKSRCQLPSADEKFVYQSDFSWNQSLTDMEARFERLYEADMRLKGRAFYDPASDEFIMELDRNDPIIRIRTSESFLQAVIDHIEEAVRLDYAQFVFFSDMGHSHFLVPRADYERDIRDIPVRENYLRYEKMMNLPGTKIVYHTAEQLKMVEEDKSLVDDDFIRWRYYTRNLVGGLAPDTSLEIHKKFHGGFNTIGELSGYRWWGGGFYLHANKQGCFSYREKDGSIRYFDISYHSLPLREYDWASEEH